MKEFNESQFKNFISDLTSSIDEESIFEIARVDFKDSTEIMKIYFDNLISLLEGRPCSYDKSSYIVGRIKKSIENNTNLKLSETYREYQARGKNIGSITELDDICFWCPRTIPDTQTALKLFDSYLRMDMNTYKKIIEDLTK